MAIITDMTGKVALVTGAASGLGRATALKLARAGADVCLVDVNRAGLEETEALIGRDGPQTMVHTANLADPDACTATVVDAVARFGRLDALCNIAGVIRMVHSHTMTRADFEMTMAINLAAPWHLSQAAIPHLLESEGAIVNCASSAAFIGEAYAAAYCASKAGLVQMTKAMAMEYVRRPIRINAVAPGGMRTNIGLGMTMPEDAEIDLIKRYSGLRGLVEVDDVADLITLLASPEGRGYHGACLSIDAGITAG
ncbi:SDR family NAD(P)-dependent oxidoreductase [Novosphingobium album (ex Liu et al. 2023)]|uniref:SDR family NAD(P)-dependent oxidoreductase n=1 Tax=Novosphingobium album (ex Liu et al. 2023) TaxID=3031130 RepID=A0ABT5WXA4_9SPHN|nr:SDR family oxidoreductase [Novosphingobium album (ex Liu et al. 2023)]MDE8654538.1 SDR family NAD(P)-dependent oxidoreductase [Novosphingobium album (ex Liu et al. 2023)]